MSDIMLTMRTASRRTSRGARRRSRRWSGAAGGEQGGGRDVPARGGAGGGAADAAREGGARGAARGGRPRRRELAARHIDARGARVVWRRTARWWRARPPRACTWCATRFRAMEFVHADGERRSPLRGHAAQARRARARARRARRTRRRSAPSCRARRRRLRSWRRRTGGRHCSTQREWTAPLRDPQPGEPAASSKWPT